MHSERVVKARKTSTSSSIESASSETRTLNRNPGKRRATPRTLKRNPGRHTNGSRTVTIGVISRSRKRKPRGFPLRQETVLSGEHGTSSLSRRRRYLQGRRTRQEGCEQREKHDNQQEKGVILKKKNIMKRKHICKKV